MSLINDPMPVMNPYYFSCDWGTSSFRLRLVQADPGRILAEIKTALGAKVLTAPLADPASASQRAQAFHDYLAQQLAILFEQNPMDLGNPPVMVSGMASSSVGWAELPYAPVPFPIDGSGALVRPLEVRIAPSLRLPVFLISGVATATDMMRGEEVELIGLLALPSMKDMAQACRFILPGTHSKHVVVTQGRMVDFHTYMTGELFEVLAQHSILRFTTQGQENATDEASFMEGVAASRDAGLVRSLFQSRSRAILHGRSSQANRDYLSGLLLGSELTDLFQHPAPGPLILAAPDGMAKRYALAAEVLGAAEQLKHTSGTQLDQAVVLGHQQILRHAHRPATATS